MLIGLKIDRLKLNRDPDRQDDRRDQRADHQPDRSRRVGAGTAIHRRHVLLVQHQDLVGVLFDLLEGGQQLLEIHLGPPLRRLGRQREKLVGVLDILLEERVHRIGELAFSGQRDVGLLDFQVLEKLRAIRVELLAAVLVAAPDREQQSRIHPLDRFFHAFGRQNTREVLPQDHIDVPAQAVKHDDRPEAEQDKDRQGRQKAEQELGLERLHRGIPAVPISDSHATPQLNRRGAQLSNTRNQTPW